MCGGAERWSANKTPIWPQTKMLYWHCKVETILVAYKEGTIPKENINCARYREFPLDVEVEDVLKSQRALTHMNATLKEMKKINEKLLARKELYDSELKPKPWVSSEISFVQTFSSKMEDIIKETEQITPHVQHVMYQLEKRFDKSTVENSERKRKVRRAIEQKSKAKKRKAILQLQKSKESEINSSDDDMPIDILTDDLLME